jgi:hypothetical protein
MPGTPNNRMQRLPSRCESCRGDGLGTSGGQLGRPHEGAPMVSTASVNRQVTLRGMATVFGCTNIPCSRSAARSLWLNEAWSATQR